MTDAPESPLQFDAAEPSAAAVESLSCAVCQRPITGSYHMANQAIVCAGCRGRLERETTGGSGTGRLARALLFGAVGAAIGAGVYYAVLALSGYEVGLIAILVGWLVGLGVHKGSNGRGGWAYQAMAVLLTYFAIVSTYVPLLIRSIREQRASQSVSAAADSSGVLFEGDSVRLTAPASAGEQNSGIAATTPVDSVATAAAPERTLGRVLLAYVFLFGVAAALPFLAGLGNIIGILIIGFALYQAWKMNKRSDIQFSGPYQVGAPRPA